MTFYGDTSKAAKLAGVVADNITTEMQEAINDWININIKFNGFDAGETEVTEYYDIKRHGQSELILKNFPVVSVSEVVDACYTDNPKTLDQNSYVVDNDTGIIQLVGHGNSLLMNDMASGYVVTNANLRPGCFTEGMNSIRVKYKYGFGSVPAIIKQIATLMIAKWAKIRETQADADGLGATSIKIGDYSESIDYKFMGIKSEFDEMLLPMITRAQSYYAQGV